MMFTDKQLSERPKSLYIILHGSNLSELFELWSYLPFKFFLILLLRMMEDKMLIIAQLKRMKKG